MTGLVGNGLPRNPSPKVLQAQLDAAYKGIDVLAADRRKRIEETNDLTAQRDNAVQHSNDIQVQRDVVVVEMDKVRIAYGMLSGVLADAILRNRQLEGQIVGIYNSRGWRAGRILVGAAQIPWRIASEARRIARGVMRRALNLPRMAVWVIHRSPGEVMHLARRSIGYALTLPQTLARAARSRGLRLMVFGGNRCFDFMTHAAAWWRAHISRPRTMWGVTPILTLPLLARCDRLLGLRSDSFVYTTYYTTNSFDINLKRWCELVYTKYPRWTLRLHKAILRLALIRYDAFHLFCDHGLLLPTRTREITEREMQAMRWFDRRLYTYTYGADVRTREATLALGRFNICAECPEPGRFCVCDDNEGSANIARIRASATAMIAMGDMLNYVPGARNFHFWPLDVGKLNYVGTHWSNGQTFRVAHAPNHPHFKGTHYLLDAIDRLRSEGYAIELVRVQGVPNTEVLALFASCDLVADQFIAGFHGYTALEAMAVGKPVLCYLRDPSMTIDPAACPMINTWPETVYETLRDCLEGRLDLVELGRRSRAYVEHYYSLEAVALRLGALYLETARFPGRINRLISKRMAMLEAGLTPLIPGAPPVSWDSVAEIDRAVEKVA